MINLRNNDVMEFATEIDISNEFNLINTVRRGFKWATLQRGEVIVLKDPGQWYMATVIDVIPLRFCDLTEEQLKFNFDKENGRNKEKLLKSMKSLYNGFNDKEIILWVELKVR